MRVPIDLRKSFPLGKLRGMNRVNSDHPLRAYLASLTVQQQHAYCFASGTKLGYLRKYLSKLRRHNRSLQVDVGVVSRLVANSQGRVTFASLRPDVDWDCVRSELQRTHIPPLAQKPAPLRPRKAGAPKAQES